MLRGHEVGQETVCRAAVLGQPIAHSLSPVLHRAAYDALGLDSWRYGLADVDEAGLASFVGGLDGTWRGLSLTMPLKRACLDVADEVSDLAADVGVGNTLARLADGHWRADNTDVGGIVDALRPQWGEARSVAVLGSGATALSAVYALRELGADTVCVYARDEAKAAALAERVAALGLAVETRPLSSWLDGDEPALVSTLPAGAWAQPGMGDLDPVGTGRARQVGGMPPDDPDGRADGAAASFLPDQAEGWPHRDRLTRVSGEARSGGAGGLPPPARVAARVVLDVVYDGWPTPLARAARAWGATVVGGLDMLVYQAARQFVQFTGREAPVDVMMRTGRAVLEDRARARDGESQSARCGERPESGDVRRGAS